MGKTIAYGPNGTAVAGVTAITFAVAPLNFDADFQRIDGGAGSAWIATDVTSAREFPSTVRIAQQSRANVYAGTSIDPSCYLSTKRGTDTIVEVREVHSEVDSEDSTYLKAWPMRLAITLTAPDANQVDAASIQRMLARAVAALAVQGDDELTAGLNNLLHGVVRKD